MYTRLTTIKDAKDLDAGIAFIRDTVLPTLQQQRGYTGLIASVDRAGGTLSALSIWQDAAARDASESGVSKVRDEAARIIGGTLSVKLYEQTVFEAAKAPAVGTSLLIRGLRMDPAVIDQNLEYFRTEVLPQIKAQPGFRAVRQLINRETGEGMVGTAFDDVESMRAAIELSEERRTAAQERGITLAEPNEREIVLADNV